MYSVESVCKIITIIIIDVYINTITIGNIANNSNYCNYTVTIPRQTQKCALSLWSLSSFLLFVYRSSIPRE